MAGEKNHQSDWLLVVGAIIVVGIFFGGYRMGMSGEVKDSQETLTNVRATEKAMKKSVSRCAEDATVFKTSDKEAQQTINRLSSEIRLENANHDYLYEGNARRTEEVTACQGELEAQAAVWQEEDIKYREKIKMMTELNRQLVGKIDAAANAQGQPRNYLNQALDRVRWENLRMRIKLKMVQSPEGTMNPLFDSKSLLTSLEADILAKYAGKIGNQTLDRLNGLTEGENATYSGRKRANFMFTFNKTLHKNIFLYDKLEDGHLKRPVYFGRDGSNAITQGVDGVLSSQKMHKKYLRMASIPRVFRSLFNYALCAYRNNNPNITFPDVFLLKPAMLDNATNASAAQGVMAKMGEPNRTHASSLFDTPLITFCRDCRQMANTTEFKLACLGDTVDVQYGSYDFWSMRSLMRYNPLAYEKGNAYLLRHGGWGAPDTPFIAVVYRTDQRTLRECQRYRKPQRHYLYLAKNQPANRSNMLAWSSYLNTTGTGVNATTVTATTIKHRNSSVDMPKRNEPACAVSYAELMKNLQSLIARTGIKRFYISTKATAVGSLKKRVTSVFGADSDVEFLWETPRLNQPEEQLTDLVVLESAQYLLIDAFTEHSQVVAEGYLIRNEFNTDKLYVM